jgi:hypothetical protein
MSEHDWVKEFPGAIIVCDPNGIVIDLNDRAAQNLAADGGPRLIGTNALDCHPEPARSKFADMLATEQTNVYTIEKNGIKKLIYQAPWFRKGVYAGFIEFSLEIPWEMSHFKRD